MPDGVFKKLKTIAKGGFKFAKDNLPAIAATALFGGGAGIAASAIIKARNNNTAPKQLPSIQEVPATHETLVPTGKNATHKSLVRTTHKTLTKKMDVPVHEPVHKKMTATKKVVKKKPVPANMDNILNKKENTRPDYY